MQIQVTNFRKADPIKEETMAHPDFGLCGAHCVTACGIACAIDAVAVATATGGGTASATVSYPFDTGEGDESDD